MGRGRNYSDVHHIVHHRQEWELRPEGKAIRTAKGLMPRIYRPIHEDIHDNCPSIPLLGFEALRAVLSIYEPHEDTMKSLQRLMSAIEVSGKRPRSYPIERDLGELAIEALSLQIPYLEEALSHQTYIDMAMT